MKRCLTTAGLAVIVFCATFFGSLWLHGNRLVFSNDEGIILDAATRMLHGQLPYRDFFAYMSPGSYWIQKTAFLIFGLSLRAARVPVLLDFSLECALLFCLTARFAGRKAGLAVLLVFFAFEATTPEFLLAQHRMDSAALSLASIALCLEGHRSRKAPYWVAAGLAIAAAAICTPTIALLAIPAVVWLAADRSLRRFLMPYAAGLFVGAVAIAAALASSGILIPFLKQMLWLRRNYADVNVMPYGSIIGGYGAAFQGATGPEFIVRSLAVFCVALPAILPIAALAAWGILILTRGKARQWATSHGILYLLACMLLYVASVYPRADVAHLAFVAVLPAMLTAIWLARYAPRWLASGAFGILALGSSLFVAQSVRTLRDEIAIATPVGTVRVGQSDAPAVASLLQTVHPNDTLYTHPYRPLLYFLTQARNPTRYSYLAPGMMTAADERSALESLESAPPNWLLYLPLSRAEFLRVFPHATGLDHRFPLIEDWREREYEPVDPAVTVGGYGLYERRTSGRERASAVVRTQDLRSRTVAPF